MNCCCGPGEFCGECEHVPDVAYERHHVPGLRYPVIVAYGPPILLSAEAAALWMAQHPKAKPDA